MKALLIFTAAVPFVLSACATTPSAPKVDPAVAAIQASYDDENQSKTVINGHEYFCMDFAHFDAQMKAIAARLQQRGV